MQKQTFYIYSFYRFFRLKNKRSIKEKFDHYLKDKIVRGTILLADEGINATISASEEDLKKIIKYFKSQLNLRKLDIKISKTNFLPFNRIKVRLKKEIVSLGIKELDVEKCNVKNIDPKNWDNFINDKNVKIIDTRNMYEIKIGKFQNSINPKTNTFREFPEKLAGLKINKSDKLAMYCTGGIRCEKASAYLKTKGYKNIFQLKGGILNYLDFKNNKKQSSLWSGECFVFDERVTVNDDLIKGKYLQCYGCRQPITKKDTLNEKYIKGVCCPNCYEKRTYDQKSRSASRQKQIEISKKRRYPNVFLK